MAPRVICPRLAREKNPELRLHPKNTKKSDETQTTAQTTKGVKKGEWTELGKKGSKVAANPARQVDLYTVNVEIEQMLPPQSSSLKRARVEEEEEKAGKKF